MIDILLDTPRRSFVSRLTALAVGCALWTVVTGCQTREYQKPPNFAASGSPAPQTTASNSLVLHPGDTIRISFPGAPNLDSQTSIRLDGKISLPMIGELAAAGLTPTQLEAELVRIAGPQLVDKEVSVTVLSSAFEIYVTGAVMRNGKLVIDRVPTPLEAIMEAGLDNTRANLKAVQIIRKDENGQTHTYKINVKRVFKGQPSEPFALKQFDIIYVPERFNWY
jgi:polysaccharide export outer membrane protein